MWVAWGHLVGKGSGTTLWHGHARREACTEGPRCVCGLQPLPSLPADCKVFGPKVQLQGPADHQETQGSQAG